jgi:hypothetical protein
MAGSLTWAARVTVIGALRKLSEPRRARSVSIRHSGLGNSSFHREAVTTPSATVAPPLAKTFGALREALNKCILAAKSLNPAAKKLQLIVIMLRYFALFRVKTKFPRTRNLAK